MIRRRVVIADYPGIFRSGVSSLLKDEADCSVVEVDDTAELVDAVQAQKPELALVEGDLPPDSGVWRSLPAICDGTSAVIVWSDDPDADAVVTAVQAGANGFLHKDISAQGLLRAVEAAMQGQVVLSRSLMRPVVDHLRAVDELHQARELVLSLSPREREVLELIAAGARNRAIADGLHISEFTVKRHVQNILRKLDLPSRTLAGGLCRRASRSRSPMAPPELSVRQPNRWTSHGPS